MSRVQIGSLSRGFYVLRSETEKNPFPCFDFAIKRESAFVEEKDII